MRIGLFGGTFDPVHCGHLAVVRQVRESCELDRVWLTPSARSPLREAPQASAMHRLAMCRLVVDGDPSLEVNDIELKRPEPSYTADTLRALTVRDHTWRFTLIVGADALAEMPAWRDATTIYELSRIVAVARPGYKMCIPGEIQADCPGAAARLKILEVAASGVSASDVRQRVADGKAIEGLVPHAVAAYIRRHHLYRSDP